MVHVQLKLVLERKIALVSKHKSLLMQACAALLTFLFPLQWSHTFIPILPGEMIDVLDAPLPFLVGLEEETLQEYEIMENPIGDLTIVHLDQDRITTQETIQQLRLPSQELDKLKASLNKAS